MSEVPRDVLVLLLDKSSYGVKSDGCTAVSARSRLAFTLVSSLDSSIEPFLRAKFTSEPEVVIAISEVSSKLGSVTSTPFTKTEPPPPHVICVRVN